MRAQEFATEMAGSVHQGIRNYLQNRGYEYIKSGIDKHVFREPGTGEIYLVFGTRPGYENKFTPDQLMFRDWINYCNKNRANPHLPRFSGLESFNYRGQRYLQARMEPLQEVPPKVGYLVGHIEEAVQRFSRSVGRGNYENAFAQLIRWAEHTSIEDNQPELYDIKQAMDLLGGPAATQTLLKTVHQVAMFGKKHGFSVDLHQGNYMQRDDGTIVVNDPFVVWMGGRG